SDVARLQQRDDPRDRGPVAACGKVIPVDVENRRPGSHEVSLPHRPRHARFRGRTVAGDNGSPRTDRRDVAAGTRGPRRVRRRSDMAAMKPRTGDGPLEVTKEGRGIVLRMPLEGGGRLVVEMNADEANALGEAIKGCLG